MTKQVCIMVVDADERFREAVEDLFEEDGYETIGCADGAIALDVLQALRQPAVFIIGDVQSRRSGQEIVAELARHPLYQREHPIILLDGPFQALTAALREQLRSMGIPVVPKSISLTELRESVKQIAQPLEERAAAATGGKGVPPYRI